MATHFFTSITANYLPKARVLCESIRRFDPEAIIHIVWNDKVPAWLDVAAEPFDRVLPVEELGIPDLAAWLFQHDRVELSTATKGFALEQILALEGCERVVYFDPDIVVLAPLDELLAHFAEASILLTPHLSEPEDELAAVRDNELSVLRHGIFNLGFLGVRNSTEGRRFARWWKDRLQALCFDEIPAGLFTDQRWADLIPAFFPDYKVLRDAVYNVATWNLTKRPVEGDLQNGLTIQGRPIVFVHFSGLDSGSQLGMLQRYGSQMPALFELRTWYLAQCEAHGDTVLTTLPWVFGSFADGEPILRSQRVRYRRSADLQALYPDPFHSLPREDEWTTPGANDEPLEPYRVFLIAAPADEKYADETLVQLQETTVGRDQIWLVTRSLTRDVPSIAVEATRYEDFVAHVLQHFNDKDLLIVRAGAITPAEWDLRLAWTAARQLSALTVTPLDRRELDGAGLLASLEPGELDRLCYFYRRADEREMAASGSDCVFIRGAGVRDLAAGRREIRLANLTDEAARQRWQHLQTTHLCITFRCAASRSAAGRIEGAEQPALVALRESLRGHADLPGVLMPRTVTAAMTGATLHLTHNWGGGIEQWIGTFCEADRRHEHLVLKSVGPDGFFGGELELYRYGQEQLELVQHWTLTPSIRATAVGHAGYRQVLAEIAATFPVSRVIVSSLIGHSLDGLRTGLPTIYVCHDYYPYCSAINLTFGETCRSCEAPRLEKCLEENPLNSNFPNVVQSEWLVLRAEFLATVAEKGVKMVAPSGSVRSNYLRHAPELADRFCVIPHGLRPFEWQTTNALPSMERPLRLLVLGNLIPHKGVHLLNAVLSDLLSLADLTLAGCRESGDRYAAHPKIHVIPEYTQGDLSRLVAAIKPDLGIFLSVVPESFSYTLHELQSLGIPPLAANVGGFRDAIEEGVTGFLFEPDAAALLQRIQHLAGHREQLASVREHLQQRPVRPVSAMVQEYGLLISDPLSAARYFSGPHVPDTLPDYALQVYWSEAGQGFSEADSFRYEPYHLEKQAARLYVPPRRKRIGRLRFDPGSKPGLLRMERLVLYRKDGEMLWSSYDCFALLTAAPHAHVFPIGSTVIGTAGEDPQVELPIPESAFDALSKNGGYLEVDFAWHSLESHIVELLSSPAALFGKLLEELTSTREQAHAARTALARTEEQASIRAHELELSRKHSENLVAIQEALLQSLSWRVTKPLRMMAGLGRKLRPR